MTPSTLKANRLNAEGDRLLARREEEARVGAMLDLFDALLAAESTSQDWKRLRFDFSTALIDVAALDGGSLQGANKRLLLAFLHLAHVWKDNISTCFEDRYAAELALVPLAHVIRRGRGLVRGSVRQ